MKRVCIVYIFLILHILGNCCLLIEAQSSSSGILKIIAGGGVCDGGLGTQAILNTPYSMLALSNGKLLIVDTFNSRIRQLDTNGYISTIVGTGTAAYNGDGIDALAVNLNVPTTVVMNSLGELIIAENSNHRIRKVLTNGTVITIAGTGSAGFNGDGVATSCKLYNPNGMAIDSNDNIYFSDSSNNRVRKILTNGTLITIAGTGQSTFNGDNIQATSSATNFPTGIAWHPNGIYFSEYSGHRIRKITTSGIIQTVAGTGAAGYSSDGIAATLAKINYPVGVAVNSAQEIFIADYSNNRVRKVFANGTITTIAGTGVSGTSDGGLDASISPIKTPNGIAVNPTTGEIYFSDQTQRVYKISNDGLLNIIAGTGSTTYCIGSGVPSKVAILSPTGLLYDPLQANIYFSDNGNRRVDKITESNVFSTIAGTGISGFSGDGNNATLAQFKGPYGIALTPSGDLIVADKSDNRVRKIFANGTITTIAGTGATSYNGDNIDAKLANIYSPLAVAVDSIGQVYISDQTNRVRKILTNGTITTIAGTGTSGYNGDGILAVNAQLSSPSGLAINSLGEIYISEQTNRVRKILTNGTITTVAGVGTSGYNGDYIDATTAKLKTPYGLAISPSGELFIAEYNGHRIRKILLNGTIITVAGTGISGNNGDTSDPLATKLSNPVGVAVKPNGELLISEFSNSYIRLLSFQCNNTLATDPNVCNGNGICVGVDQCHCNSKYQGTFCESEILNITCFGIQSTDSRVCSGNGLCDAQDQCDCNYGWFGSDCSIPTCFDILANNSQSVCNGNGNCTNIDTCICSTGFQGLNCSNFTITTNNNNTIILNTTNLGSNNTTDNSTSLNNNTIIAVNNTIDNSTNLSNNNTNVNINNTILNSTTIVNNTIIDNSTISLNNTVDNSTSLSNNNTNVNNNNTILNSTTIVNNTLPQSNETIPTNTTLNNNTTLNSTIALNNTSTNNNTTSNATNISTNSTQVELLKCFDISSSESNVCSGHGLCVYHNVCKCHEDSINGYWGGVNCTECKSPYSGNDCKTAIISENNNYYAFFAFMAIPVGLAVVSIPSVIIVKGILRMRKPTGGTTNTIANVA